jgi:hypothetical protein
MSMFLHIYIELEIMNAHLLFFIDTILISFSLSNIKTFPKTSQDYPLKTTD